MNASTPDAADAVRFGRRLTGAEQADYEETVRTALQALGKKNLSLILHGASFPALPGQDTGFGSPYGQAAKNLLTFLKTHGFNSLQLGPSGKTKRIDPSPYVGTVFSTNPLFIDLPSLVAEGLLSQATLDRIVAGNPENAVPPPSVKHRTAYGYIHAAQDQALAEAYQTFLAQANDALKQEFAGFKTENRSWLKRDALYEALATIHGNDYWPQWPDALDQRLFSSTDPGERAAIDARIAQVEAGQAEVIDRYAFVQWLAHRQLARAKRDSAALGIQWLADRQVGFSDRDVWAYQTLFLKDYALGAPPDYFSRNGQSWDFPVLDPAQIFNPDGSPGPAGDFLKALFDKTFAENPGGVRIDHIIGLIDPWVYPKNKTPKIEDGAARLFSSPEHPALNPFGKIGPGQLNPDVDAAHDNRVRDLTPEQVERYAQIVRLVIASAQAHGIPLERVICEDLGTLTQPVRAVMDALQLSGIRVTQFVDPNDPNHLYRGRNVAARHWVMAGSHDNMPLWRWVKERYEQGQAPAHVAQIKADLMPDGSVAQASEQDFYNQLDGSPWPFLTAKLAELFASPAENVQVFFTDFFGIDAYYNRPATSGNNNWSLRLPNDFEGHYEAKLKKGLALNMPQALKLALKARWPQPATAEQQALLDKLARYEQILQAS